ncbi:MAG: hypothetical protein ACK504_10360 [Bacteroidota bacterium]
MQKITRYLLLTSIFFSCKKASIFEKSKTKDIFIYPLNKSGKPLCVGSMYLLNEDSSFVQSKKFDCTEEKAFYFSGITIKEYIIKIQSQNMIGFAKIGSEMNGIQVTCK